MQVTASFDMQGVRGTITFRQTSRNAPVVINVQLQGISGLAGLTWHVHEYPLPYDIAMSRRCSAAAVGSHFDPFRKASLPGYSLRCARNAADCEIGDLSGRHGDLVPSREMQDRFLTLYGQNSIMGRSIVIHRADGSRWVCATIGYPASSVITAVATFAGPAVAGTITLRQVAEDPSAETTVFLDLGRADRQQNSTRLSWQVSTMPVNGHSGHGPHCDPTGSLYDPLEASNSHNYSSQCSAEQPLLCALGDLSGKHGHVEPPVKGRRKAFFVDPLLPLSGPYSVLRRPIVISSIQAGMTKLACANLMELLPRRVSATFDMKGVRGTATFLQLSPWDTTEVKLQLSGLQGEAGGFHVHEYPLPPLSAPAGPDPCSATGAGGHWNPFNMPFPVALASGQIGTHDIFEIGDISGRHGSLAGHESVDLTYTDSNLPLYGPYSIIGRSVVVHRNQPGAPRWACANIGCPSMSRRAAFVRMLAPFAGHIYFRQVDQLETTVIVELSRADGKPSSAAHNWHVHVKQVALDQFSQNVSNRCQSVGGHYNPFGVALEPLYQCSTFSQQQCEIGDLSGKSARINMPASGANKFVYTDSFLPLEGPFSIVKRSVVVHGAQGSGPRLACADIEPFNIRRSQATFSHAGVSGFVAFRQTNPFEETSLQLQLSGLGGQVSAYSIHQYPIAQATLGGSAGSQCGTEMIGGEFRPVNTNPVPSPAFISGPVHWADSSGKVR